MPYNDEEIKEPKCPTCGGKMWDNRLTKRNPKAPDFKCRDRSCDGVLWPEKGEKKSNGVPQPTARPLTTQGEKQPYTSGPPLPYETQTETGAPPSSPMPRLDALFNLYDVCFDHAYQLAHKKLGNDCTHEGIAAQAATLFIAAKP